MIANGFEKLEQMQIVNGVNYSVIPIDATYSNYTIWNYTNYYFRPIVDRRRRIPFYRALLQTGKYPPAPIIIPKLTLRFFKRTRKAGRAKFRRPASFVRGLAKL